MTKDIPEIDDLLKGINDPEMTLTDGHTETTIEQQSAVTQSKEESAKNVSSRYRITPTIGKISCPILKTMLKNTKEKG